MDPIVSYSSVSIRIHGMELKINSSQKSSAFKMYIRTKVFLTYETFSIINPRHKHKKNNPDFANIHIPNQ